MSGLEGGARNIMHKSVRRFLASNRLRIEEAQRLLLDFEDDKASRAVTIKAIAIFQNAQALLQPAARPDRNGLL